MIRRDEWSDEAFDLVAAHPDPVIRAILAASPAASPQQRVRLLDDPRPDVRSALVEGPYGREHQPLPPWAYQRLAVDPSPVVRMELARSPWVPRDVLTMLTNDPDADVAARASAALRGRRNVRR